MPLRNEGFPYVFLYVHIQVHSVHTCKDMYIYIYTYTLRNISIHIKTEKGEGLQLGVVAAAYIFEFFTPSYIT